MINRLATVIVREAGLELEYWVIDAEGALRPPGRALADLSFVEREAHPCVIEVKTEPCESLPELRSQLSDRLDRTLERARDDDHRLVPIGTALDSVNGDDCRRSPRIDAQRRLLGESFRRALSCAGTHVHFEQREPAAQINALIALDPALALVNTTPYSDMRRIATCARPYVYRRRCYEEYPTLGQLWPYAESAAEWRRRLSHSYEQFARAATSREWPSGFSKRPSPTRLRSGARSGCATTSRRSSGGHPTRACRVRCCG